MSGVGIAVDFGVGVVRNLILKLSLVGLKFGRLTTGTLFTLPGDLL